MQSPSTLPEPITLHHPPHLTFGVGAADQCAEFLRSRRFSRVLLVKSSQIRNADALISEWRQAVDAMILDESVPPEPDVAACEAVVRAAGDAAPDAVIGLGGGSVLDVAKLVAAVAGATRSIRDLLDNGPPHRRKAALICLPTTSGTGSEASPNAILYDEEAQAKRAAIGPALIPDATFVDPRLTLSLPPDITAATGIDALSHCIEAFTNRNAHPVVDLYALEGIRRIAGALERAVKDGNDLAARSDLSLGSLYGGYCLGPVNTAAVHALSYPLGSRFRLPHGLSNALLLPYVLRFNIPADPERHAIVARALGVSETGDPSSIALSGVHRIHELIERCGLPAGLSACGVTAKDIPSLAEAALKVTRLLKNNPRTVTQSDAERIYQEALES